LQVVGRRVDISLEEEWGERAPRTRIVAIGAAGRVDAGLLEETFDSCISAAAAGRSIASRRMPRGADEAVGAKASIG
jgi:hypothetical protein